MCGRARAYHIPATRCRRGMAWHGHTYRTGRFDSLTALLAPRRKLRLTPRMDSENLRHGSRCGGRGDIEPKGYHSQTHADRHAGILGCGVSCLGRPGLVSQTDDQWHRMHLAIEGRGIPS